MTKKLPQSGQADTNLAKQVETLIIELMDEGRDAIDEGGYGDLSVIVSRLLQLFGHGVPEA